jgi:hypothetical protein
MEDVRQAFVAERTKQAPLPLPHAENDHLVRMACLDEMRDFAVARRLRLFEGYTDGKSPFKIGDMVLRRNYALDKKHGRKFEPRWQGPYVILRLSPSARSALLKPLFPSSRGDVRHHFDHLRLFHTRDDNK